MKLTHSRFSGPGRLASFIAIPALPSILLLSVLLLGVYWLDHRTGAAPVQHLYYLPLILAALRFGATGGLLAAGIAIALYHFGNERLLERRHSESDIIQILIFIGVPMVTAKLVDDARRLRMLASTDDLTGLANLRGFEERLGVMVRYARSCGEELSMLVLDVDHLKTLNDAHGHLTGADAVRATGRIIATTIPPDASACRYGGDEFAIAVPGNSGRACGLADDLRRAVRQTAPILGGRPMPAGTVTISVGVATRAFGYEQQPVRSDIDEGEELFRSADEALYLSKRAGRDRTSVTTVAIS